jgi:aspartate carbamoyltransferase catalytic subunit
MNADSLVGRNLLSINDLSAAGLAEVLDVAESFVEVSGRSVKKIPALKGKVVASLFFEESTRTRLSFETAAKRLSADVLSLAVASSSVKKGESLKDTIETIESLGIDAVVLRHRSSGAPHQVARWVNDARVINAGDGTHEHPSQALIDLFSVRRALAERQGVESRDSGLSLLKGAKVLIIGDVNHSRVARSEMLAYTKAGAKVRVIGPGTLLPNDVGIFGAERAEHLEEELGSADVISLLRMQEERGSGDFVPSLHEFSTLYGIDERRAALIRPDAVITHPGPMVRGVEVSSAVADDPRMLVRQQVANGVPIRMAILFLALSTPGESLHV